MRSMQVRAKLDLTSFGYHEESGLIKTADDSTIELADTKDNGEVFQKALEAIEMGKTKSVALYDLQYQVSRQKKSARLFATMRLAI